MEALTIDSVKDYAVEFLESLSNLPIPSLYGITDGKAVGTYVEASFHSHLMKRYRHTAGSAASGIDFPELSLDLKVTSVRQPQSSCPFRSASQKVYGLGYSLLVFVYTKHDDPAAQCARLHFEHAIFIDAANTGDFQTTRGLRDILSREGNLDDVVAFLEEKNLPLDEIGREKLAERILSEPPNEGVLTMSNALQWRLQYGRAIVVSGKTPGVDKLI